MLYNKSQATEAKQIHNYIAAAKAAGEKYVDLSMIEFDNTIKILKDIGYDITYTNNGVRIELE